MQLKDHHWLKLVRSRHQRPTRHIKKDIVNLMDYVDNLREGIVNLMSPQVQQMSATTKNQLVKTILSWQPEKSDEENF